LTDSSIRMDTDSENIFASLSHSCSFGNRGFLRHSPFCRDRAFTACREPISLSAAMSVCIWSGVPMVMRMPSRQSGANRSSAPEASVCRASCSARARWGGRRRRSWLRTRDFRIRGRGVRERSKRGLDDLGAVAASWSAAEAMAAAAATWAR